MGLKSCPETSVTNYKSILRNILEERRSLEPFTIYTNYLVNKMNTNDNIISYLFWRMLNKTPTIHERGREHWTIHDKTQIRNARKF